MDIEKLKKEYLEHYDEMSDSLYRFLVFQTSNREVSSDLLQETFMKTWEYIASGKEITNLRAFLYKVAKNKIIDYRRKKKPQSLDAITDTGVDFHDETDILEEQSILGDIEFVFERLEILDDHHKELIILRFVEEMSIKEIAEIFQERPNTISVKIHRAVEKLKEHIHNLNKQNES